MTIQKTKLAFIKNGKVEIKEKSDRSSEVIVAYENAKKRRDDLTEIAQEAENKAVKAKEEFVATAQKEVAKMKAAVKAAEKAKHETIEASRKPLEDAEAGAEKALVEAADAARDAMIAADAVTNIAEAERAGLLGCIEVSEEDCAALDAQVASQENLEIVIKDGTLVVEEISPEILWDRIKSEARKLLAVTDRAVSVIDYRVGGKKITQTQLSKMIACRDELWAIINNTETETFEGVVLPILPFKIE